MTDQWRQWRAMVIAAALAAVCAACGGAVADAPGITPEYNKDTGKLERLTGDRNKDGKVDTWAHMDGVQTVRIDIDRDGDGRVDRVEFYVPNATPAPGAAPSLIDRAEESDGRGGPVVRRESYRDGIIARVDEDTDGDGRADKWEHYDAGTLARVEMDLQGKGFPSRRLVYAPGGGVVRVEADPDGDGVFEALPAGGKGDL
jgi:hypothetical protein